MPLECALYYTNGIVGSNSKRGRADSSAVIEFNHEVYSPIDTQMGSVSGARVHGAVEFVKPIDAASPLLYKHATTGEQIDELKFSWYNINPTNGQEEVYFTHTLTNVKVAAVEQTLPNTKDPSKEKLVHMEKVQVLYEKINWHYQDAEGKNLEHEDSWKEFA